MKYSQISLTTLDNKRRFDDKLAWAYNAVDDPEAKDAILRLRNEINSHNASSDVNALDIDYEIDKLLEKLQNHAQKKFNAFVSQDLENIGRLISKRGRYCTSGTLPLNKQDMKRRRKADKVNLKIHNYREKQLAARRKSGDKAVADLYTLEELMERLGDAAFELNGYRELGIRLKKQLDKNPRDVLVRQMLNNAVSDYESQKNIVDQCQLYVDQAQFLKNTDKEVEFEKSIRGMGIDESRLAVATRNASMIIANNKQRRAQLEKFKQEKRQAMATADFGETETAAEPAGASAFTQTGSMFNSAAQEYVPPMETDMFDGEPTRTKLDEAYETIDELINAMKSGLRRIETEIGKAENERVQIGDKLKELLIQRRAATPGECLALDSKIDALTKQYKAVQNRMKMFIQKKTTTENNLSVAEGVKTSKSTDEIEKAIEEATGGKYNYNELSNLIRQKKIEGNQILEDSIVNMEVADVEVDTGISVNPQMSVEINPAVKDDDKYADWEIEIGMRKSAE